MKYSLPPHIGWPLFIVAILLTGVTGAVLTVIAAHSDGGAQVVEDYYEKASNWDATAARRAASKALGWTTTVQVLDRAPTAVTRPVQVTIRDAQDAPVAGLEGTVQARRPELAGVVGEAPLAPVADQPGTYEVDLPVLRPGLWDFDIAAQRGTEVYETSIRREVPR